MTLSELRYARVHCGPIGMWVWVVWRLGSRAQNPVSRTAYRVLDMLVVRSWAGARVPASVSIGARVGFVHDAHGLVIHPRAVIGDDVTIYHQVTIGKLRDGVPTIGNGVLIGAGAKVLGGIHVGDYAAIGPNAVVTSDVPSGATVLAPQGEVRMWSARPQIPRR